MASTVGNSFGDDWRTAELPPLALACFTERGENATVGAGAAHA
ncbi:hypothetical protein [Streptomyces sp. NPDC048269]